MEPSEEAMRRKKNETLDFIGFEGSKRCFFEENLPVIPAFLKERPRFCQSASHFQLYRIRQILHLFYQWLTKEFSAQGYREERTREPSPM